MLPHEVLAIRNAACGRADRRRNRRKNKITRFLTVSLISVVSLCVVVCFYLAISMGKESENAVSDVSLIYMLGMSEQIARHF